MTEKELIQKNQELLVLVLENQKRIIDYLNQSTDFSEACIKRYKPIVFPAYIKASHEAQIDN